MMRKVVFMAFCYVVAAVLCGASPVVFAQSSTEQRQTEENKEKKKDNKDKKKKKATAQKQTKPEDKAQKKNDPKAGVNQAFDSFKKDLGSARKSTNDAWDKSK